MSQIYQIHVGFSIEDENLISELNVRKYKSVKFVSSDPNDKACNHCAFELGKCRGAIWVLGQYYVVEGDSSHRLK